MTMYDIPPKHQNKFHSIVSNTDEVNVASQIDSSSNIISSKESMDDDFTVRPEFEGNWENTQSKVNFKHNKFSS